MTQAATEETARISTSARTVTPAMGTQLAPTPTVASTALAWTGTLELVYQETAKISTNVTLQVRATATPPARITSAHSHVPVTPGTAETTGYLETASTSTNVSTMLTPTAALRTLSAQTG